MRTFDIKDYRNLDAIHDLKPEVVRSKLEVLVKDIPSRIRPQVDRCYFETFTSALKDISWYEQAKTNAHKYFTEDPQSTEFHKLAFPIFCIILTYAGSIGDIIRTQKTPEVYYSLKTEAQNVFKYALTTASYPPTNRQDLQQFQRLIRGKT